jgi:hypothetical protein
VVSGGSGGQRTLAASSSAADRTAALRPPSSRPDGIGSWPQFPEAPRPSWQGPQAAGATAAVGGCAWMVGSRRPRCPCPAQGLRPCPRGQQPSGQHRPHPVVFPAAPRTLPRCPVPRTPAGFRARSARPADSDGPDAGPWTRLMDSGSRRRPALPTPATVRRAASAPTRSRWQTASRSRRTFRTYAGSGLTWIGVDIKPGTYRSAGPLDGSSGYWARLSDTSGEGIITNDIATGQAVVTIAPPTKRSKRPGCRTGRRSVDTSAFRRRGAPGGRTDAAAAGPASMTDELPEKEQTAPGAPHSTEAVRQPFPISEHKSAAARRDVTRVGDRTRFHRRPDARRGAQRPPRLTLDPPLSLRVRMATWLHPLPGHARGCLQAIAGGSHRGAERDTARTGPVTQ